MLRALHDPVDRIVPTEPTGNVPCLRTLLEAGAAAPKLPTEPSIERSWRVSPLKIGING
jgi:hypothetical protein